MRHCGNDRGAFAIPGIVKIAVALAVLGLLGYDTFFTIATHLKAESDAQNAAYAASQAWFNADGSDKSANTAFQAALVYLAGNQPADCRNELTAEATLSPPGDIPLGCDYLCTGASNQAAECGNSGEFTVDQDGTVHLVIRRQAKTLLFGHLGFMHSLLVAYEHGDANQEED
ncbi:MAG TPA: hypothetical protein VG899_16090 [Mycobacteriales bacterium]|nr:hypothetical protein [Mycobacteriales bacterium]HWA67884.1 hypothetical protein [Mycobacteriales bacterium]